MKLAGTAAGRKALGTATAAGVEHMAHRFIVGESPQAALRTLEALWRDGIASSVDLLGEATVTTAEADRYAQRCDEALSTLTRAAQRWPAREQLERDSSGPIPRVNLSVKVTALTPLMRPLAPDVGREDAAARMRPLLRRARGPRRPSARRHGVGRRARDHQRPRPRAARRAGVRRRPVRGRRAAGLSARLAGPARAAARVGAARRHARRRWSCGWSRAPTGTTRWSRRASTAGRPRCSRTRPSATATSRR